MEEKEYKAINSYCSDDKYFEDKGPAYYVNIRKLTFTPIEVESKAPLLYEANKARPWRLFGLIPLFPIMQKEDIYAPYGKLGTKYTAYEFDKEKLDSTRFLKDRMIYRKASVKAESKDVMGYYKFSVDKHFTSNEEAMRYYEHVKNMCRKYSNELSINQE